LSITTVKPGYAGLAAKILSGLRPVGGIDASFQQSPTLGSAIGCLLQDRAALDSFLELRVSDSEIYANSHGRAAITYSSGGTAKTAHYVGHTAVSLLQPGAEKDFNHRELMSSVVSEIVFYAPFFRSIANEIKREDSASRMAVAIPPEDEDEETRKEERTKRLGILPNSRKALAIYREARNAEQNYLISYAVLSYYKIVELKHQGKSETRTWFARNYEALKDDQTLADEIALFKSARGTEEPGDYLYRACRVAVAHANKPYSSDPDDSGELRRLHVAARILRALARRFIRDELGVSECPYDGS
jgi:methylamine utilization protein MauJ